MKPAFTKPIEDALSAAGLSINDINSVVLVGGTSRVPMIQEAVANLVGTDKISKNLNADEAAVMGAALYGAGLSRQYRTKDIRLAGLNPYAIDVAYTADNSESKLATSLSHRTN
jgi:hypoxia up-regulated 1